jgi:hypothetical protein
MHQPLQFQKSYGATAAPRGNSQSITHVAVEPLGGAGADGPHTAYNLHLSVTRSLNHWQQRSTP